MTCFLTKNFEFEIKFQSFKNFTNSLWRKQQSEKESREKGKNSNYGFLACSEGISWIGNGKLE